MTKITIEELIHILNCLENKEIQLEFKGTIEMKLKIGFSKILKTKDYIEIFREGTEEKIKFCIHQIMKVDMLADKEILVEFDGYQIINILIKK